MNNIKKLEDIDILFKEKELTQYTEEIKRRSRPKIELIELNCDIKIEIGKSKIGGRPDLKSEIKWPKTKQSKSMSFIAQINCEDVTKYDTQKALPEKGLISFFYCPDQEPWGFDPEDKNSFKVIFTENLEDLENREYPKDMEPHAKFSCSPIAFDTLINLPDYYDQDYVSLFENEEDENIYSDLLYDYNSDNQIFGYANIVQNPMELQCQLVTNGLYCGDETGYEDPRAAELEKDKSDWILLLQIDSNEEIGMMWGDCGRIYFWIKKQDLKAKNFDNVWTILQCY